VQNLGDAPQVFRGFFLRFIRVDQVAKANDQAAAGEGVRGTLYFFKALAVFAVAAGKLCGGVMAIREYSNLHVCVCVYSFPPSRNVLVGLALPKLQPFRLQTVENTEFVGMIVEALNAESYKTRYAHTIITRSWVFLPSTFTNFMFFLKALDKNAGFMLQ
jgi:hypothetical protein